MSRESAAAFLFASVIIGGATLPAAAQSFRVQCPTTTITHPSNLTNVNQEPNYTGPTVFTTNTQGYQVPLSNVNGAIKCQQVSGGDGYSAMANGTETFMFSFGPLSGLADIANGLPGTEFPNVFNSPYPGMLVPGDPATTDGASTTTAASLTNFTWNGAVGIMPDLDQQAAGLCGGVHQPSCIDGRVDARQIMDIGVMNGNIPAPLIGFDEDDELFLTLTNVGMIMRPDLFEQHTIHFHGYPNASSFYDGDPDGSVGINIGGSFTYYYLAPDAGTYFWHCHITPPEHLQMGMVGQLFVRPRQDRTPAGKMLISSLTAQQGDLRTACKTVTVATAPNPDPLCTNPLPADGGMLPGASTPTVAASGVKYVYNDGDGISAYNVVYPIQIHGFDPNFHFVGMAFNPEAFVDMKDKLFLLNGRSYPDTITPGPLTTESSDGRNHFSQPLPSIINLPAGQKALLRIADLSVTEYATLAALGIPMHVVGYNAKLLRDQEGNNMDYYTNSITLGGGESLDVILDASDTTTYQKGQIFYLFTPQLDHLSNDQENFGGLMTEIHIL